MEFADLLKDHINHVQKYKNVVQNEEQTKQSLIMPFFKVLGYDVLNPFEFVPEYTADVGIKKGEKVDYAIIIDDKPLILVECKSVQDDLDRHSSQLYRYFGTTDARFGILTNGVIYKFYSDLDQKNKMDSTPFLTIDLENLLDRDIPELQKFTKDAVDVSRILDSAEILKYSKLIKDWFITEMESPSPEFVKSILNSGIYQGAKTQNVVEKFTPIVKKAGSQYVNDLLNSRIKIALTKDEDEASAKSISEEIKEEINSKEIETTLEELEAFAIIKAILRKTVDSNRIFYKDTRAYFGILLDNNTRKWICRVYLQKSVKYIVIAGESKEEVRHNIKNIDDIYDYASEIIDSCAKYL